MFGSFDLGSAIGGLVRFFQGRSSPAPFLFTLRQRAPNTGRSRVELPVPQREPEVQEPKDASIVLESEAEASNVGASRFFWASPVGMPEL